MLVSNKETVARVVPEEVRTLRLATPEARAVDDVGVTLDQGPQKPRQVLRVVLKVRILNEDDRSTGSCDAVADGSALACVFGTADELHVVDRRDQSAVSYV